MIARQLQQEKATLEKERKELKKKLEKLQSEMQRMSSSHTRQMSMRGDTTSQSSIDLNGIGTGQLFELEDDIDMNTLPLDTQGVQIRTIELRYCLFVG